MDEEKELDQKNGSNTNHKKNGSTAATLGHSFDEEEAPKNDKLMKMEIEL